MITNWKLMIKGLFIFLCFLSLDIYVPCSLMAGVGDNMSLSADPTSIPADGLSTTNITAVVDHNGASMSGVTLTFTTLNGFFKDPTSAVPVKTIVTYSDTSGASTVVLYSDTTPETATITCVASGNGTYTNPSPPPATSTIGILPVVTRTVDVYFSGPDSTNSIVLSATPLSAKADNIEYYKITATLYDQYGAQIKNPGIPVVFTTTPAGRAHFANGPTSTTITVSTDATGTATVLLYSAVAGSADVSALTNGVTGTISVIFTGGPTASIVLSATPTSAKADNLESYTITAKLYDQSGKPILQPGIPVVFTTTPAGRAHFANGPTSTTITVSTDASGEAKALLYSAVAGSADISASTNGVTSTISVIFTGGATVISTIVLSADPPSVPADDLTPSTITAKLYDQNGVQIVKPGILIYFTISAGGVGHFSNGSLKITVSTGATGTAAALLYSSVVGTADISASTSGIPPSISVFVNFTGCGPIVDIVLSLDCSGSCDGRTVFTITATLYDKCRKVSCGLAVDFKTTIGYFSNKLNTITLYTDSTGVASVVLYSGGVIGTAQVSASSNGITRYLDVIFSGVGPPAIIYLNAAPERIPADGTYSVITAVIMDSAAQRVAAGTLVTFSTTKGVFGSGKDTYVVATPDSTGTITVYLRAKSITATGYAVVTCKSGGVEQALNVQIVQLEYETEPNNDMAHADGICFDYMYLSQLFSPYDEDWYTFTITEPSRIGVNFITTAAPADAGCDSNTTTVGTWKVDIRDLENNVLMSRHNIDCTFDNGIWETGVVPQGTYYVVVYCPKLGEGFYYLSDSYYMSVFNDFYFPCSDNDKLENSASLTQKASTYQLRVPIIDTTPYLWADLQYDPIPGTTLMFRLSDLGVLTNLDNYRYCNLSILSLVGGNYVMHIPQVIYDGVSYRADLTYVPTTDGQIWFMLSGLWAN